jgi:hypothetical protein
MSEAYQSSATTKRQFDRKYAIGSPIRVCSRSSAPEPGAACNDGATVESVAQAIAAAGMTPPPAGELEDLEQRTESRRVRTLPLAG